jgi:hypothetical protein
LGDCTKGNGNEDRHVGRARFGGFDGEVLIGRAGAIGGMALALAGCAQLLSDWSSGADAGAPYDGTSSGASTGSPNGSGSGTGSGSSSGVSEGGVQTSGATSGGSGSSTGSGSGAGDAAGAGSDAGVDAGCGSLTTDANCGACGYACVDGRHCSGGRCTPAWLPMTTTNAPTARSSPGASIAGKLIVAGGNIDCIGSLASAAAYDPSVDAWTNLPDLNSARSQHTVVSSGTAAYAFGGLSDCANGGTQLGTLERWSPGDATWTVVSGSGNAATARYAHISIWTGSGVLVYGGSSGQPSYVASGAVYSPGQNTWADASCSLSGCERDGSPLILDQGYVKLWGGGGGSAPAGLEYEVANGTWSAWMPPTTFPTDLSNPADDGRRIYFPSGGGTSNLDVVIYDRQTQTRSTDSASSPANLSPKGSIAWIGSEVVLWSGATSNGTPTPVGGRYQPPAP